MQCKTPAKAIDLDKLKFEDEPELKHVSGMKENLYQVNLLINLKKLFGKMIYGCQDYYNPEEVFNSILGPDGKKFSKNK